MRHLFRTSYEQDTAFWRRRSDVLWYAVLMLVVLVAPAWLGEFSIGELSAVFIFAIAGVGAMLLVGYTGLINLGIGAFLGIGAYTHAILMTHGVPFVVSLPLTGLFAALCGVIIGLPTLRMSGLYLAIATLAFGSIVSTIFAKWTSLTGGFDGLPVPPPNLFGFEIDGATGIYYLALVVLVFVLWLSANILRSPLGRAMIAVRDSEISAQSMGINLARTKTIVFAISSGMTGLAGALFAHYINYLAPDVFDVTLSIQFITIVFVGGLGSLRGVIFGAIFVRLLPQAIALTRDQLPFGIGQMPGLEPALFGLVLVGVILFRPTGINGFWLNFKSWFNEFPLRSKGSSRRQKSYGRSERVR